MRVTIVGAGLSGISQAIQIRRQLGDRVDLTIIECDDDIGGIWLNSTWPGAGVDLPIHLYSIYTDPQSWTNVFATQADMWTYLKSCVARYGTYELGQR
jgi:cation diffusion facilitator CzcD-associated flavoprotein CzcO